MSQETLVPDDAVQDLVKETHYTFLSLNPMEIAMQLTMNDYKVAATSNLLSCLSSSLLAIHCSLCSPLPLTLIHTYHTHLPSATLLDYSSSVSSLHYVAL